MRARQKRAERLLARLGECQINCVRAIHGGLIVSGL